MPPGDPRDQGSRAQRSDRPDEQSPDPSTSAGPPDPRPAGGQGDDASVDFGSYVSSTVRSSAELFGTPARAAPVRRRQGRAPAPEAAATTRQPAQPSVTPPRAVAASAGERPSRYWRDSLAPSEPQDDTDDGGGDGRTGGPALPWTFGDGQRPSLTVVLAGLLIALIAIAALIWYLNRDGDDQQQAPPPTQTDSVIETGATEPADEATPPSFIPSDSSDEDPTEEPTPTPRRGGDNQRDNPDDETPEDENSTDVDLDTLTLGPVASQCSDRCLVRIQGGNDAANLMSTARTRASFTADEWTWVVASAPGIAYLELNAETVFVLDSAVTIDLYMASMPPEETTDDRLAEVGTVIDSAGSFRLLRADRVPANVKTLTDWGYQVQKLAPAPPSDILSPEEPVPLGNVEIGALMDDVSGTSIEQDIRTLQAMGSGDTNGIGTRYYTTRGNSEAAEFLFQRLESLGLKVWYEDFLSWEGYLMVNVLAEIPGQDDSAIYGVMAHFDTIAPDINLAPGGDDNATGVSGSLEIARILSGYTLQHPVHIIFVNVEEVGIVGSQHFARNAKANGVPYEGVFNLDSIGAQRQYAYMVVNGNESTTWMVQLFREINEAYGLGQVINAQMNEEIVADDNRLREYGIDSMMIARELYGQSPTHHTSDDVLATVWIDGVVSCTQLTLLSLASLVQA